MPGLAENLQAASSPVDSSSSSEFEKLGFSGSSCHPRDLFALRTAPNLKLLSLFCVSARGLLPKPRQLLLPGSFYPACFPLDKASALQEFALEFKYSKACCVLKAGLGFRV